MKSKAYRAVDVNRIEPETLLQLLQDRVEELVYAGLDIGKEFIYCTLRWGAGDYERPWRRCGATGAGAGRSARAPGQSEDGVRLRGDL